MPDHEDGAADDLRHLQDSKALVLWLCECYVHHYGHWEETLNLAWKAVGLPGDPPWNRLESGGSYDLDLDALKAMQADLPRWPDVGAVLKTLNADADDGDEVEITCQQARWYGFPTCYGKDAVIAAADPRLEVFEVDLDLLLVDPSRSA